MIRAIVLAAGLAISSSAALAGGWTFDTRHNPMTDERWNWVSLKSEKYQATLTFYCATKGGHGLTVAFPFAVDAQRGIRLIFDGAPALAFPATPGYDPLTAAVAVPGLVPFEARTIEVWAYRESGETMFVSFDTEGSKAAIASVDEGCAK